MTRISSSRTGGSFPIAALSLAVIFNALVLLGLGYLLNRSADLVQTSQNRYLRLVELRGEIAHLDEVLTMSTRMAAASGELSWEQRYLTFEPQLDAAITEAERLAPPAGGRAAHITDAANQALIAMESKAFDLVRSGDRQQAEAILNSKAYEHQKFVYSQGLDAYMDEVLIGLTAEITEQRRRNRNSRFVAVLGGILQLVGWYAVVSRLNAWRARLQESELQATEANEALVKASEALRMSNATLEERVDDRTAELRESHSRLRNLSECLLQAETAERERLALVLHDDLQQLLVSAHLRLGAVPIHDAILKSDIDASVSAVRRAIDVSRSLSSELSSDALAEEDLVGALVSLADRVTHEHGLPVETDISSIHAEMSMAVKHFVVRAARELLFNVVKHAKASSVSLTVREELPELTLMIRDDGTGLSGEYEDGRLVTGLGLPAIRRRTEWLGGQFTISSVSGKGTTATLRVPCG